MCGSDRIGGEGVIERSHLSCIALLRPCVVVVGPVVAVEGWCVEWGASECCWRRASKARAVVVMGHGVMDRGQEPRESK